MKHRTAALLVLALASAASAQVVTVHVADARLVESETRLTSACAQPDPKLPCDCPPITAEIDGEDCTADLDAPQFGLGCTMDGWPDWDLFSSSWVAVDGSALLLSQAVHRDQGGGYHYFTAAISGAGYPGSPLIVTAEAWAEDGPIIAGVVRTGLDRAEVSCGGCVGMYYTISLRAAADHNMDGAITSQDIFDFMADFYGSSMRADQNSDGSKTSQDIFDFLTEWYGS